EISNFQKQSNELEQKCLQYEKDIETLTNTNKDLQQKYDSLLGEMNNRITTGLINNSILNTPNQPRTLVRHMNYQSVTPVGSLTPAQGLNSPIANTPRNFDITLGHSPNIPNLLIKDLTSTSITNESASIESMKQSLERQNRN
ncbi:5983_t:CDS:2, partial [Entrophospora sp. SA101]